MMKKKLLKSLNNGLIKFLLFLVVYTVSLSCKTQINIYSDLKNIKSTHIEKNAIFKDIVYQLEIDDSFEKWKSDSRKCLIISSLVKGNDTIIRVIPRLREAYSIPKLHNNYSAYLICEDVLIVYWGEVKLFLNPIRKNFSKSLFCNNVVKMKNKINNDSEINEILIINNEEYFGCEFLIKNGKLTLIEKGYFGSPIIK